MKKLIFIFAALLAFATVGFGQKSVTNYSGTWNLDTDKSAMGDRSRVSSMKMTVTQSETELSYTREVEREAREGMGGGGMGGRGRGGGMGGNQASTFDLTGKETTAPGGRGGDAKLKAEMTDKALKLVQKRTFNGQMGEMTVKIVEKWTLSEDKNTLTVSSEIIAPQGNRVTKMIFTRAE